MGDQSFERDEGIVTEAPAEKHVLLSWLLCVSGWLFCALMGLGVTVLMKEWPRAHNVFFWAVVGIMFCNALLFLSIPYRWNESDRQLVRAVAIICFAEALVFGIFYLTARFAIIA